jgi:hypothetical protein
MVRSGSYVRGSSLRVLLPARSGTLPVGRTRIAANLNTPLLFRVASPLIGDTGRGLF